MWRHHRVQLTINAVGLRCGTRNLNQLPGSKRVHQLRMARGMLTFRASITLALTAFVVALGTLLTVIPTRALRSATQDAASAYMDATSTKAFGRLKAEATAIASLVHVLANSSSIAD